MSSTTPATNVVIIGTLRASAPGIKRDQITLAQELGSCQGVVGIIGKLATWIGPFHRSLHHLSVDLGHLATLGIEVHFRCQARPTGFTNRRETPETPDLI